MLMESMQIMEFKLDNIVHCFFKRASKYLKILETL